MTTNLWRPLARLVMRVVGEQLRSHPATPQPSARPRAASTAAGDYPGCPEMVFGRTGPGGYRSGEVVWTWVAFEEDASQGKDRPVLLVGSDAEQLLGLPATSQDHDRDAEQERRAGRYWVDIGQGSWDSQGRASEVRLDRIVRVDPASIRRIAGRVPHEVFAQVKAGVTRHWDD